MKSHGFFRISLPTFEIKLAEVERNLSLVIDSALEAIRQKASLIVFPSMCLTGASLGDLVFDGVLLEETRRALKKLCTLNLSSLVVISLPLVHTSCLYECAFFILRGKILLARPLFRLFPHGKKEKVLSIGEEERVFLSKDFPEIPFGKAVLENEGGFPFTLSMEDDFSDDVFINLTLSSEKESYGFRERIASFLRESSFSSRCAWVFASSSQGESTSCGVYSSIRGVYECGEKLSLSETFSKETLYVDVDLERIHSEKIRAGEEEKSKTRRISFSLPCLDLETRDLRREVSAHPFIPQTESAKADFASYVLEVTSRALAARLSRISSKGAVIALSGGLDSTLAFLITSRALKLVSLPSSALLAVSMPCFGSSERTKRNAFSLASLWESEFLEVDIAKSVTQHFMDISHPSDVYNVTFENAQARERTQVLLDLANERGYLAVGTSDMSEAALGWCTFGGDNVAMYNVNGALPKTVVREVVKQEAKRLEAKRREVLEDILFTPISPELLPINGEKESAQKSEDILGSYELHDFFLYYFLRFSFSREKILFLSRASSLNYSEEEVTRTLKIFYHRFMSSAFKRQIEPSSPNVFPFSVVSDFEMPCDLDSSLWTREK